MVKKFHCEWVLTALSAAFMAMGSSASAQIKEEGPLPGLEEGVLLDVSQDHIGSVNTPVLRTGRPGEKDFSVVIEVGIRELGDAALFWDFDWGRGWMVDLKADGSVQFTGRDGFGHDIKITTPPHSIEPHQAHRIVVSVKRNPRQPESGIWIDGVELASGAVPPVDCGGWIVCRSETKLFSRLRAREYNRALTRPEILELNLRGATAGPQSLKHLTPPADGPRYIPQQDETIVLLGGTEAVRLAEAGGLEGQLLRRFPNARFHFRCLAWEGDTVFRQDRPMNFGSLEQQLHRVNAGTVFMAFGRQECLEAKMENGRVADEDIANFKSAFEKLLATIEKVTPNLVIFEPMPFERKAPPFPDLSARNEALKTFARTMEEAASEHHALFVSTASSWKSFSGKGEPATEDGVTMNRDGLGAFRWSLSKALGIEDAGEFSPEEKSVDDFWNLLHRKNRLWHDYWRPSNWAFLYGDRTNQPSSRDPVNPQIRLFPAEQEKYLPLIKQAEEQVYRAVEVGTRKLP